MQTKGDRPRRADFCATPVSKPRSPPPDLFSDRELSDLEHHLGFATPIPSLVFSNTNSPLLSKRAQIGRKSVSPKTFGSKNRSPVLGPRFGARASARLCDPSLFGGWPGERQSAEENASEPLSRLFCAESTAVGSREKDGERTAFKLAAPFDLSDDDELERAVLPRPDDPLRLAVSELIKMRPAFELVKRFYEANCCEGAFIENFLAMAHEFELQILQALFAYLQLASRDESLSAFAARLPEIASRRPNRKKKKAKMIQMIFVQAFAFIKTNFAAGRTKAGDKTDQDRVFFEHYFGGLEGASEGGLAAFDYAQNMLNGNLSYKFYERVFASPAFAADFLGYLRGSFLAHYQEVRRRKLKAIFSRWEKHFLDFIDEREAVRLVVREIASPRFKFVFHDCELQKYFRFFQHFASK